MDKFKEFFRTKGFYIALCVGILAFAILMVANDYRQAEDELTREQAIDLNQPAENIAEEDTTVEITTESEQIASNDGEADVVNSDNAVAQVDEDTSETTEDEEALVANSDGAEADLTQEEVVVPELVFDEERSLVWPLIGNIILPYSMDTTVYFQTLDVYKCNPGILIEAEEGASVVSVCSGVVTEITDTKEYGTVVKVNLGSGYEATYGQVMNVFVSEGEAISESQPIAEVGPVSSYYMDEGNHLYFAITKDGEPVDPMTLIQ